MRYSCIDKILRRGQGSAGALVCRTAGVQRLGCAASSGIPMPPSWTCRLDRSTAHSLPSQGCSVPEGENARLPATPHTVMPLPSCQDLILASPGGDLADVMRLPMDTRRGQVLVGRTDSKSRIAMSAPTNLIRAFPRGSQAEASTLC